MFTHPNGFVSRHPPGVMSTTAGMFVIEMWGLREKPSWKIYRCTDELKFHRGHGWPQRWVRIQRCIRRLLKDGDEIEAVHEQIKHGFEHLMFFEFDDGRYSK